MELMEAPATTLGKQRMITSLLQQLRDLHGQRRVFKNFDVKKIGDKYLIVETQQWGETEPVEEHDPASPVLASYGSLLNYFGGKNVIPPDMVKFKKGFDDAWAKKELDNFIDKNYRPSQFYAADIWRLGVHLHRILFGEPRFFEMQDDVGEYDPSGGDDTDQWYRNLIANMLQTDHRARAPPRLLQLAISLPECDQHTEQDDCNDAGCFWNGDFFQNDGGRGLCVPKDMSHVSRISTDPSTDKALALDARKRSAAAAAERADAERARAAKKEADKLAEAARRAEERAKVAAARPAAGFSAADGGRAAGLRAAARGHAAGVRADAEGLGTAGVLSEDELQINRATDRLTTSLDLLEEALAVKGISEKITNQVEANQVLKDSKDLEKRIENLLEIFKVDRDNMFTNEDAKRKINNAINITLYALGIAQGSVQRLQMRAFPRR
jgi:hypothetical protein